MGMFGYHNRITLLKTYPFEEVRSPNTYLCQRETEIVKENALYYCINFWKKVQIGKDKEKAQSEKIPTPKTEVGKNQTNNQVLIP